MANLFQVNVPDGVSMLKLDSTRSARTQVTVKNVSARPIDGRAVLISLPQVKPPSGPVEKGWVKIDGKADRHFDVDKEEVFTVKVAVPPNSPAGNYTFRMDAVWVDKPDIGDSSAVLGFTVAASEKKTGHFPLWLIPVLLVVVIGIGVGVWLAVRGGGPKVPDLVGMTLTDADAALKTAGLTLDSNVQTVQSKPEDSGKIVSQMPASGGKASKGQNVQVTLGAEMVSVPQLIGHTYQEVLGILNDKHLAPGQTKTVSNPNFAGGVVVDQTPAAQQAVKAGTAVDMQVTPQMVTVPNVTGQLLGNAITSLKGLTVTSFSGDTTKTVIAQNPPPGTSVPVGSSATLTFPPPLVGCANIICLYQGNAARLMVLDQVTRTRDLEKRNLAPR
jgi:beta-lactam-binding protein with PASTA domain